MTMTKVYWIAKYTQSWDGRAHSHSFYQMFAPISGGGRVLIGGEYHPIRRGCVLIVPPDAAHCVLPEHGNPPKLIDVKFSLTENAPVQDIQALPDRIELRDSQACLEALENILTEADNQEAYFSEVVNMAFSILLISLIRGQRGEKSAAVVGYEKAGRLDGTFKGIDVAQLLKYINQNFNRIICLDDLCRFAHVSKTTLIDIFKEVYGTTPIKYLNHLRMQKARELLADSDISIGEISLLVGFQSIHYFSRSFKQCEGCSPLVYRRNHRDSRYITIASRPDGG